MSGVLEGERFFVPHRKRLALAYVVGETGQRELVIDYGLKEVTFDDERFFAFGEQLVRETSFTGADATAWGSGYAWPEVADLLEALLAEGIIHRGEAYADPRGTGIVPSLVPPATCAAPRFWSAAECEGLTRELTGRAIEIGYLEAFVPVYRIAHPALDTDDRQVGEANVYPATLRLERETEWRVCQYAGSRYRDETPMNVTALKAMIKHWKPIVATIQEIRRELHRRLPDTRGGWTLGQLCVYASVVLGAVAYPLARLGGSSPQRRLDPVLSSMFRITDGIRMVCGDLLYTVTRARSVDEPIDAAAIHAHAEREGVLIGETGVCAGPRAMIDDFLATVVDRPVPEAPARELPPDVQALVDELPRAVDYALYGLQVFATSQSVWLSMSRAYEALLVIDEPGLAPLRVRLAEEHGRLAHMNLQTAWDREVHDRVYVALYHHGWHGTRHRVGPPTLHEAVAAAASDAAADAELRRLLAARLAAPAEAVARVAAALIDYVREEQAVLAITTQLQATINALLERPRPARPLTIRDLRSFHLMSTITQRQVGQFPYLLDAVADELGIAIEATFDTLTITDSRA